MIFDDGSRKVQAPGVDVLPASEWKLTESG